MLLRPTSPADLPLLLDVQQEDAKLAFADIFPQDTHPFPRAEIQDRWTAELADPAIDAFVVVREHRIEGFAALRGDELMHFGTAVHTWGTGLAAQVHTELVALLKARGTVTARLYCFEQNHRARRFYEKLGWRPTGNLTRTSFPPHPVLLEYTRPL